MAFKRWWRQFRSFSALGFTCVFSTFTVATMDVQEWCDEQHSGTCSSPKDDSPETDAPEEVKMAVSLLFTKRSLRKEDPSHRSNHSVDEHVLTSMFPKHSESGASRHERNSSQAARNSSHLSWKEREPPSFSVSNLNVRRAQLIADLTKIKDEMILSEHIQSTVRVDPDAAAIANTGRSDQRKLFLLERQGMATIIDKLFALIMAVIFLMFSCAVVSCMREHFGVRFFPSFHPEPLHITTPAHEEVGGPKEDNWMIGYEKWYNPGNVKWAAFEQEDDARIFYNNFYPSLVPRVLFDRDHVEVSAKGYNPYATDNIRTASRPHDRILVPGFWNVGINHGGSDLFFYYFKSQMPAERFYHTFRVLPKILFDKAGSEVMYHNGNRLDFRSLRPLRRRADESPSTRKSSIDSISSNGSPLASGQRLPPSESSQSSVIGQDLPPRRETGSCCRYWKQ